MKLRALLRGLMPTQAAAFPADELFAVRPGYTPMPTLAAKAADEGTDAPEVKPYRMVADGIAEVQVTGFLSRHRSLLRLFGWSDQPTMGEMGAALRAATADPEVKGVLLYVDSPGGTVKGTPELAAEVAATNAAKPVHVFAQDVCSAAYWVASQASSITLAPVGVAGSIGVVSILLDASKAANAAGFKFHVLSTGPLKGAGLEPGAGITEAQLKYFQSLVDDMQEHFVAAVAGGRGLAAAAMKKLTDGACYVGAKAVAVGLADTTGTYADAVATLLAAIPEEGEADGPPSEPVTLPDDPAEEEVDAMSEKNQTPASAGSAGTDQEKASVWKQLGQMLGITAPDQQAAAAPPPAAPPASVTAEQVQSMVDAGIKRGMAEQSVTLDLAKLEGKVTPGTLAEAREALLEARIAGNEAQYARILKLTAGQDASALLGGPVASATQAKDGVAGLGVNAREMAALEACGMKAEDIANIEREYNLRPSVN